MAKESQLTIKGLTPFVPFVPFVPFILLFLILYVPFLNKAYHIDDFSFISQSKVIGWNPITFTPTEYNHFGRVTKNYNPHTSSHPMFIPYFIKLIASQFGYNEIIFHTFYIIFPVIALFSLYSLNGLLFQTDRETNSLTVFFTLTMPAFIVNSHSLMADVPTLAFILASTVFFCLYIECGLKSRAYLGSLFACLALFTSYQAAFFIPLILFYAFFKRKIDIHLLISLSIPVIAIAVWLFLIYRLYDFLPLIKIDISKITESKLTALPKIKIYHEIEKGLRPHVMVRKIISILAIIGSSMLFVTPVYFFIKRSAKALMATFLSALVFCSPIIFYATDISSGRKLFLSALVSMGLISLYVVVKESLVKGSQCPHEHKYRAENYFLLSWIVVVMTYSIFILPFGAARYILPALPPIVMILLRGSNSITAGKKRIVVFSALTLSVIFGLASAYSDYRYADTYREFAAEVKKFREGRSEKPDVWYIGAWGMQHYMGNAGAGARYLLADSNEPRKGDFIVVPEMPRFWSPSPMLWNRMRFFASREFASPLPLRLFNRRSGAGFYCHFWGLLPFSISFEPDEVFTIFKVDTTE